MQNRFIHLLQRYTSDQSYIDDLWTQLQQCYTEKHRAYHNLSHLEELFHYFDRYINELVDPDMVSFSIFYHDIIYHIWQKDNEEKSAKMAAQQLQKLKVKPLFLEGIQHQILATTSQGEDDKDVTFLLSIEYKVC